MEDRLYKKHFDKSHWGHEEKLSALVESIAQINQRAESFLSRIAVDFPQLTDHSIEHSLMLWNYLDIVLGEEKSSRLNPLEAYVLHIAFLSHDAGTCLSVLDQPSDIKSNLLYQDYVATYGDDNNSKKEALFYTIRHMHGEYARQVATQKLSDGDFLIQDEKLRDEFANIIGRVAESHANSVNFIETEITKDYASPSFPKDWAIRCRRLAYLLRVVDAAHLDNIRTPKSIKLIKSLKSPSREHWTFQKKLGIPTRSPDRFLVYTANSPFNLEEQRAWWYCHEALTNLDREIKTANEYFEAKGLPLLAVKGVKDVNDPLSLSKETLRAEGWYAFDSRVRVSNPVHIATELGGIKLYGEECLALRELLQNAIDAINAYRVKTDQNLPEVGLVKVLISQESGQFYLTVTDNGIGMSSSIMTNELLDFGTSYWKTNRFRLDHQGLASNQFEAIGKFGIGFFSVFMLGNLVTITSWRHGDARAEMRTLEFYDGLASTPILRDPTDTEKRAVIDRGTSVRICLSTNPYSETGFIGKKSFEKNSLDALVRFLVPSADVIIEVMKEDGAKTTIEPQHLEKQSLKGCLDYLATTATKGGRLPTDIIRQLGLELIEVSDGNRSWGKLVLNPPVFGILHGGLGIAISKGIRVCPISSFIGFARHDEVITIKRDTPSRVIPFDVMREWGKKQKAMILEKGLQDMYGHVYWGLLLGLDLYEEDTPILLHKAQANLKIVTIGELKSILQKTKELKVYGASFGPLQPTLQLDEGYVLIQSGINLQELLLESDLPKVKNSMQVIEDLCRAQWSSAKSRHESFVDHQNIHFVGFPNPHGVWIYEP